MCVCICVHYIYNYVYVYEYIYRQQNKHAAKQGGDQRRRSGTDNCEWQENAKSIVEPNTYKTRARPPVSVRHTDRSTVVESISNILDCWSFAYKLSGISSPSFFDKSWPKKNIPPANTQTTLRLAMTCVSMSSSLRRIIAECLGHKCTCTSKNMRGRSLKKYGCSHTNPSDTLRIAAASNISKKRLQVVAAPLQVDDSRCVSRFFEYNSSM